IVGTYGDGAGTHGFVYSNGNYITLDHGSNSALVAINNLGDIVGRSDTGDFIYKNGAFITITGVPGAVSGINDADQLVGSFSDGLGTHGFVASLANHVPVATNIATNAKEDTGNPVTLTASYTDADPTDFHTFTIDNAATIGTVINNGDGTFNYDPNGQFEYL